MTATESVGSVQRRRRSARRRVALTANAHIVVPVIWLLSRIRSSLHSRVRRLAVAVLSAALALAPLPLASAHDPLALSAAEAARHAALVAQDIAEHGHSHEDGDDHEQSPGHMHGHDPADHSHQFAFFPGNAGHWGLPAPQRWPSFLSGPPDPATGFGIDRPPKSMLSA